MVVMNQDIKKTLWATADKLRSSMDAAEYKHLVLGLIFLEYISDAFDERRGTLAPEFQNPKSDLYAGRTKTDLLLEDQDYYSEVHVFWVHAVARWEAIRSAAKQPSLRRHKNPPDMEHRAIELVMKQAEAMLDVWVA